MSEAAWKQSYVTLYDRLFGAKMVSKKKIIQTEKEKNHEEKLVVKIT